MSRESVAHRVLVEGDHVALRRLWPEIFPHVADQAPKTDADAEFSLHYARTIAKRLPIKLRVWSHRWLIERDFPSGLPDCLRPSAEQATPRVASAVGIAVHTASPIIKPALDLVRGAMEDAVLDAEAHGRLEDSDFVKARMREAKGRKLKELFGSVSLPKL